MKKALFLLTLFFTAHMMPAMAQDVILTPTSSGNIGNDGSPHRTPITIPEAYIDGYTLTFDESCIGCTVTLFDGNGEIVYIDVVDENGVVEIPNTFVGTFELQLVRNGITFVGEIEL
ncbi:MAG: hypothetical protein IJR02_08195 [Bacteroidaceae bacterium]|nr:hypothetical protein [Bacteroidaceae bacterium]